MLFRSEEPLPGRVYLATPRGLGLVHTQDVAQVAEAVERGIWTPEQVLAQELPQQYGYVRSPAAIHGASR